eukprot:GHVT01100950.1.p1 GENE.GHVT01100950.1~~GHVT01100950.1.p1  ORF type:complete len:503 (-),score=100.16 GHVT01100950.1:198-1706(-)
MRCLHFRAPPLNTAAVDSLCVLFYTTCRWWQASLTRRLFSLCECAHESCTCLNMCHSPAPSISLAGGGLAPSFAASFPRRLQCYGRKFHALFSHDKSSYGARVARRPWRSVRHQDVLPTPSARFALASRLGGWRVPLASCNGGRHAQSRSAMLALIFCLGGFVSLWSQAAWAAFQADCFPCSAHTQAPQRPNMPQNAPAPSVLYPPCRKGGVRRVARHALGGEAVGAAPAAADAVLSAPGWVFLPRAPAPPSFERSPSHSNLGPFFLSAHRAGRRPPCVWLDRTSYPCQGLSARHGIFAHLVAAVAAGLRPTSGVLRQVHPRAFVGLGRRGWTSGSASSRNDCARRRVPGRSAVRPTRCDLWPPSGATPSRLKGLQVEWPPVRGAAVAALVPSALDEAAAFGEETSAAFPAVVAEKAAGRLYLDSAATSHKPAAVLERLSSFYRSSNSNVHRAVYKEASEATAAYEAAREAVARWVGARSPTQIVFTSGATEAINLVAHTWG